MNKARRHSFNEGDGLKLKRLNVLYPNTFVKQHLLDKRREHERKKIERFALQLRKKNTILSSCQKQIEANFRPCQRQLILHNHEIKIQSLSQRHSSYEGIRQMFQRKQFVESKYKVDKLVQLISQYISILTNLKQFRRNLNLSITNYIKLLTKYILKQLQQVLNKILKKKIYAIFTI